MTPEEIAKLAAELKAKTDADAAAAAAAPSLPGAAAPASPKTQMRDEISKGLTGLMAPKDEDPMARSKNNAITIAALRGSRRDMSGNLIDETTGMAPASANAFKNDTFQTRDQRIMKEADAFGVSPDETYTGRGRGYLDAQGVTDQMRKQGQAFGGLTTEGPDRNSAPFEGLMTPMLDSKGKQIGKEYMLDPTRPDATRFRADNFGQITSGMVTPRDPTVPVISDESGPQFYPAKPEDISQEQEAEIDAVRAAGQAKSQRNILAEKALADPKATKKEKARAREILKGK
jgi:hypothetical protein